MQKIINYICAVERGDYIFRGVDPFHRDNLLVSSSNEDKSPRRPIWHRQGKKGRNIFRFSLTLKYGFVHLNSLFVYVSFIFSFLLTSSH